MSLSPLQPPGSQHYPTYSTLSTTTSPMSVYISLFKHDFVGTNSYDGYTLSDEGYQAYPFSINFYDMNNVRPRPLAAPLVMAQSIQPILAISHSVPANSGSPSRSLGVL